MEIKASTTYSFEFLRRFNRFHLLRRPRWVIPFLAIVEVSLLIIFVSLLATWSDDSLLSVLLCGAYMMLPLMFLLLPSIYVRRNKKMFGTEIKYVFKDDSVSITSDAEHFRGGSEIEYSHFEKVYETKDCLYMYINKYLAYLLPKDRVENGRCEELTEFLKSKFPPKKYIVR